MRSHLILWYNGASQAKNLRIFMSNILSFLYPLWWMPSHRLLMNTRILAWHKMCSQKIHGKKNSVTEIIPAEARARETINIERHFKIPGSLKLDFATCFYYFISIKILVFRLRLLGSKTQVAVILPFLLMFTTLSTLDNPWYVICVQILQIAPHIIYTPIFIARTLLMCSTFPLF